MEDRLINNAQHWRDRAEKVRANAEQMRDVTARVMMIEIAEGYEKLARRADERNGFT